MPSTVLKRKEISYLQDWATLTPRKPLVIRGARQVGKSTLVREFAQKSDLALLEINFERNPEFRGAFDSNDPGQILSALGLLTGEMVTPGTTLLFLDEIQAAPEALVALRYFYEEKPALHVVAAGSLLEFTLADAQFSMPVGRVEYMHLGPMQFEDFLIALGHPELAAYLQSVSLDDIRHGIMPGPVHEKYLGLLRQYWIVGGMPEAVNRYATAHDYAQVARIQQSIVATYRDDFNKYSHGKSRDLVQLVFDRLPALVGRKFKYSHVSRDDRAASVAAALGRLCMSGVATRVIHSAANGIPLGAQGNERNFKTLYMDVGLMCVALHLNVLDLQKDDLTLVNNGAIAEQFIGQHLQFSRPYFETPGLYYWMREAKSAAAEVDYLLTSGQQIVPVEIKAGTTGSLKSLHQFLKEKQRHFGVRFNAGVPGLSNHITRLTDGSTINYELLSLPLYMVSQVGRLIESAKPRAQ